MLYNDAKRTVVLTRQVRLPTYVNGNDTGMPMGACAGLLDKDNPEAEYSDDRRAHDGGIDGEEIEVVETVKPTPQELHWQEILKEHRGRDGQLFCWKCGINWPLDSMYICSVCGANYCIDCVWRLVLVGTSPNRWICGECGGELR